MSQSAIQCRSCHRILAQRHHSGRIAFQDGVRVVMLANGNVEATCSCGATRTMHAERPQKAA